MSTIDIGIPTYRRPQLVVRAVESVLDQSFDDWGLHISSSDPDDRETIAAIEPYLVDPRISLTHPPRVNGDSPAGAPWASAARNWSHLAGLGTAEYVALLHDDDLWGRTFLQRRIEFLELHPDCGFVFSGHTVIDQEGATVKISRPEVAAGVHTSAEAIDFLMRGIPVAPPTPVWRRSLQVEAGGPFDERFLWFDWEMWLRFSCLRPVGFLEAADDCFYRVHGSQFAIHGRWSETKLVFWDHVGELIERYHPDVAMLRERLEVRRADTHVTASFDATELGQTRVALSEVSQAARTHPPIVASRRFLAALGLALLGPVGRAGLARTRPGIRRRRLGS